MLRHGAARQPAPHFLPDIVEQLRHVAAAHADEHQVAVADAAEVGVVGGVFEELFKHNGGHAVDLLPRQARAPELQDADALPCRFLEAADHEDVAARLDEAVALEGIRQGRLDLAPLLRAHVVGGEAVGLVAAPVEDAVAEDARRVEGEVRGSVGGDAPCVRGGVEDLGRGVARAVGGPDAGHHDFVLLRGALHHHPHGLEELDAQRWRELAPAPCERVAHHNAVALGCVVA